MYLGDKMFLQAIALAIKERLVVKNRRSRLTYEKTHPEMEVLRLSDNTTQYLFLPLYYVSHLQWPTVSEHTTSPLPRNTLNPLLDVAVE